MGLQLLPSFFLVACPTLLSLSFILGPIAASGQETAQLPDSPEPGQNRFGPSSLEPNDQQHQLSKNHILWVIPNYCSDENPAEIKPLAAGVKMKVAFDDSFDPSAFLVAGVFAGVAMAQKQYTSFGIGGLGKYYGGAFADQTGCLGTERPRLTPCLTPRRNGGHRGQS